MDKLINLLKEYGGAIIETSQISTGEKEQALASGRTSIDGRFTWIPALTFPTTAEQAWQYSQWYPIRHLAPEFIVKYITEGTLLLDAQFKNPRDLLHTSPVFKAIYMGILHNKTSPFHIIEDLVREQMNLHEKIRELNYAIDKYRLPIALAPTTDKFEEEQ